MPTVVNGMVQVACTTHRIARLGRYQHRVVRNLDDLAADSSSNRPLPKVSASRFDTALVRNIVRVTTERAKSRRVGRLALA